MPDSKEPALAGTLADLQALKGRVLAAPESREALAASIREALRLIEQADRLVSRNRQVAEIRPSPEAQEQSWKIEELNRLLARETAERGRERAQAAQDSRRLRLAFAQAEQRTMNVKNTVTFRLGHTVINGFKSFAEVKALPARLLALRREVIARRAEKGRPLRDGAAGSVTTALDLPGMIEQYHFGGISAVLLFLDAIKAEKAVRAVIYTEAAKHLFEIDPVDGIEIARMANKLDPKPFRMKWLAFKLFEAGQITEAMEWLRKVQASGRVNLKPSEVVRAREIEGSYRILSRGIGLPVKSPAIIASQGRRVAYVASSVLPFHTSGYTSRTESIVRGLRDRAIDVTVFARPGYPYDRADVTIQPEALDYVLRGVPYRLSRERVRRDLVLEEQLERAAKALVKEFQEFRPAVVQAASDHRNALPALIAARQLGLPFVYEVRGLWEFTTSSKHVNWEVTERFEVARLLEGACAGAADSVMTLTPYLRDELVLRGVDAAVVGLVPNCVDVTRFRPRPLDLEGRLSIGFGRDDFVVGYAGSLVEYEGLDDLILALDYARDKLPQLRLLIVGEGTARPMLEALVRQRNLRERVVFTGRVSPDEVDTYISRMNAYAVPRRPERVCHLVSPLKPLEAMAMLKPVIVSDVGGMSGMVEDQKTGFVHVAGDFRSLAGRIEACLRDPARAEEIGRAARRFVEQERTWDFAADTLVTTYGKLAGGAFLDLSPEMLAPPPAKGAAGLTLRDTMLTTTAN